MAENNCFSNPEQRSAPPPPPLPLRQPEMIQRLAPITYPSCLVHKTQLLEQLIDYSVSR